MKPILDKKNLFKKENVTIAADLPKSIVEEKKRLQPMVTALNNTGVKSFLRMDEVIVEGRKLNKEEVEEMMKKFQIATKRARSTPDIATQNKKERKNKPMLNTEIASQITITQEASTPTTTSPKSASTPSRIFPVFSQPQKNIGGMLSPLPGGSRHSKTFDYQSTQ